jgi:hypothetical protein
MLACHLLPRFIVPSFRHWVPKFERLIERDLVRMKDPAWKTLADRLAQDIPLDEDFGPFSDRRRQLGDGPRDAKFEK